MLHEIGQSLYVCRRLCDRESLLQHLHHLHLSAGELAPLPLTAAEMVREAVCPVHEAAVQNRDGDAGDVLPDERGDLLALLLRHEVIQIACVFEIEVGGAGGGEGDGEASEELRR